MAREFGIRSYNPEKVNFAASGSNPSGPWNAVQRALPKNILLEASNNPSTLEELSVELGIAMPYIEEEVKILEEATLLKKVKDKYITDFFIIDKESQGLMYTAQRRSSKERSELIDTIATESLEQIRKLGIVRNGMSDNDLKWWVVIYSTDHIIASCNNYDIYYPTKRSNGETWGFIGYENVDLPESIMMGHNGSCFRDVTSWAYKISDYGMWDRAGEMDSNQAFFLADAVKKGRKIESFTDVEKGLWQQLENRFAHAGENGEVIPDVLFIKRSVLNEVVSIIESHPLYDKARGLVQAAFEETMQILQNNSNPILKDQLAYCASMQTLNIRMMTVHDEVEAGRLIVPEDPASSTAAMWIEFD